MSDLERRDSKRPTDPVRGAGGVHRIDELQGQIVHVYDGIEEADNALPRWWLATFYGAIVFAIGYWFAYHSLPIAPLPMEQYAAALADKAGEGGEVSEELLVAMTADPAAVAQGRAAFEKNCVVCHAARGEGKIGPNLTDAAWLHGSSAAAIHGVIRDGVAAKGMPAWGPVLGGPDVQKLAAFVLTIRGTNVPGKAPQGTTGDAAPEVSPTGGAPSGGATQGGTPVEGAGAAPAREHGAGAHPAGESGAGPRGAGERGAVEAGADRLSVPEGAPTERRAALP